MNIAKYFFFVSSDNLHKQQATNLRNTFSFEIFTEVDVGRGNHILCRLGIYSTLNIGQIMASKLFQLNIRM